MIIILFSKTRLQSEEIVSELVHSFLLPEVQKITVREKGIVLKPYLRKGKRNYLIHEYEKDNGMYIFPGCIADVN